MIKLFVGLGNPGKKYLSTRHNQGFLFLDFIASAYRLNWSRDRCFDADVTYLPLLGSEVMLAKPRTYMNCSGLPVGKIKRFYKFGFEEILIVHDDLDLLPGVLRFKKGGSTGGHNGLKSIQSELRALDFCRLRIGIGHPGGGDRANKISDVAEYVLSSPEKDEQSVIEKAARKALDNLDILVTGNSSSIGQILHACD